MRKIIPSIVATGLVLSCGIGQDIDGLGNGTGGDDAGAEASAKGGSGAASGGAPNGGAPSGGAPGGGGAGGSAATGGSESGGGSGGCGTCPNGFVCDGSSCQPCGSEGALCCAPPQQCPLDLVCSGNHCVRCPAPGAHCCQGPGLCGDFICDSALNCVPCGNALGALCCNQVAPCATAPPEAQCCDTTPNEPGKCEANDPLPDRTCKVCCARCVGGNPQKLTVGTQTCAQKANTVCGSSGNVVFSDWRSSC